MATETQDPICGMPVRPDSPFAAEHGGRTFRFCSTLCRDAFLRDPTRVLSASPAGLVAPDERTIAYFSMEIALDPRIPTYSGGLGVLAGDTLRSCADLGLPLVGVTLLHREGYLRQRLDERGNQIDEPDPWPVADLVQPLAPTVTVEIEGRGVRVRAFRYEIVGRSGHVVPVLLLDTALVENTADDRALAGRLYGGDERYRLAQEIVLGIGGVRLLRAAGYDKLRRYHLNEGHAAFAPLELVRAENATRPAPDWRFDDVRARCLFTTHTPVPAGHDRFDWGLVRRVLGTFAPEEVLRMLADHEGVLNTTALALDLSRFVNGVAKRHEEVSREMFPGYGIHHVTNGVHSATWTCEAFRRIYDRHLPGWESDPAMLRNAGRIPDGDVWAAHVEAKGELLDLIRRNTGRALDPEALTIGFARRATLYKRAALVFSDLGRLRDLGRRLGRLQLVFAGKAHPRDEPGKDLIRRIFAVARELGDEVPVVFVPNYDMTLAKVMTAGVDLWLNTPQRPLEASGTSGMKAAHNGIPSLSVLDGWWLEGQVEGVTGWSIGRIDSQSDGDADDLYRKLELILPLFHHDRARWIAVMKGAITLNASFFNTHRMVQQYAANAYL
jgi:starch phosphorylase